MNIRIMVVLLVCVLYLMGCTAAGVPATSDPQAKIAYAKQLKDNGRPIPAQKLLLEALSIYQEHQDYSGLAHAYLSLGNLYKSNEYQEQSDFFKKWNEYKSYKDAANYFELAAENYLKSGNVFMAGMAKTGSGDAYGLADENFNQCKSYDEAEVLNRRLNSSVEMLNNRIKAFREHVHCD